MKKPTTTKPQPFAVALKAERTRLKLTQDEAARFLGVSARAIWKWEHGDEPMGVTAEGVLARLAKEVTP